MRKYILLSILIVIGLLIVPIGAVVDTTTGFTYGIVDITGLGTHMKFFYSPPPADGIANWNWMFGDGHALINSNERNPINIYSPGNYTSTLTIKYNDTSIENTIFTKLISISTPIIPTAIPTPIPTPIPETNSFGDIFLGESNLNVSSSIDASSSYIGWWSPGVNIHSSSSDAQIAIVGRMHTLTVSQADFATHLGKWYNLDSSSRPISLAFNVVDPYLELQLWNDDAGIEITNGKIARGTNVKFKIDTNMYSFPKRPTSPVLTPINIRVIASNGAEYTTLAGSNVSLRNIPITSQPQMWSGIWDTDYVDNGVKAFNTNEYTIYAESTLNNIRDNYDRTGKTISTIKKLTIVDSSLSMSINKDSIIRGNSFTVNIVGKPSTIYHLWITKTTSMGEIVNSPPKITLNQEGVDVGAGGNHTIYSSGIPISSDVPVSNSTNPFYANVKTGTDGTRTVSISTSMFTKDQRYTIRVEEDTISTPKYDDVQITVGNGGMSIVSAGGPTYFMGEKIKLSGTNTESSYTYLYMYGPNLNSEGASMHKLDPRNASVINDDPLTFKQVPVAGDGSWEWEWSTSSMSLDTGSYIIYAVSLPKSRSHLIDGAYATTSIKFGKPTLSATVSQKSVAKGDKLRISGYAEGDPGNVAIWVMGKNYATRDTVSVDGSEFYYDLDRIKTLDMASGQYYVVIQHPMQNDRFDVYLNPDGSITNSMLGLNGTRIFQFSGAGSLQGTDAANALINAIDDVNIDDMYTKLIFTISEPYLTIDNIGLVYIGERITITGKTNLAVDTSILIDINALDFRPTNKTDSNLFTSSAVVTVPVVKGDDSNRFSATIDFSTFRPDEYLITASAIGNTLVNTQTFVITDATRPPDAPRVVTTLKSNVSVVAPTVVPTATARPAPVATTNKPLPGYGAVIALIGLIIVSTIISYRK